MQIQSDDPGRPDPGSLFHFRKRGGNEKLYRNPDGTISLFDHLDEAGLINTILAKHDIIVNSISMSNADLENYFIQVTGGDR